jgi:transglutaminase-like putative cysteine protease
MMKRILILAVMMFLAIQTQPSWAKSRAGVVTLVVDLSAQEKGKEAKLWIPYPVSDRYQAVSDVKVAGDYTSSAVYTDRTFGTPILYAEWPKDAVNRKLTFTFSVERQEIRQTNLPAKEPKWNSADYAEYLKATSLGPIDGDVKKLALQITRGNKTVLAKARAIYDWVCDNMYRDPDTVGCGLGDVCALLLKPGGKCTDISSFYIALCRAAGVPAREVFSIRLGKKAEENITTYQHCWAEFFLPGYGWVTVDPADVRKAMLVEKLERSDPKAMEYREYFWGGIDPYRVVISIGRDLMLTPAQAGAPLNTFGYPYAEVGGKVIDFYKPASFTYTYIFTEK